MWRGMGIGASLLAATLLTTISATPAAAANLDLGEMASALVFPIITGGQRPNALQASQGDVIVADETAVTLATVTNGKSDPVRLKVDVISGDAGESDNWRSTSFDCDLTGHETTVFVLEANGAGSKLSVECSDLARSDPEGKPQRKLLNAQNGILFVAVADPETGTAISEDVIFGDAVIVDKTAGQAYAFSAIPFQAGKGQNDGNKVYRFDDLEYNQFPSVLATNFLAPTEDGVEAELILFTLDGTTGLLPPPRARLGGVAFNDDEEYFDFTYIFDCFDVVSLLDLDPNFVFDPSGIGLGSVVGHVELTPQPIAAGGLDAHDAQFGDANNSRRRPVHGWIVQSTRGTLVPQDAPVTGTPAQNLLAPGDAAAWGRELTQSRTSLRPFLADQSPVLNADPHN